MSIDLKVSQAGTYVPPAVNQVQLTHQSAASNGNAVQTQQSQAPAQNGVMSSAESEAAIKALEAQQAAIEAEYQQKRLALLQKMNSPSETARWQNALATVSFKLPDPIVLAQHHMAQQNMRWELPDGTYVGQMKNGQPHGRGVMTYRATNPNKYQMYEGEFVNGQIHGKGVMIWTNGDRYTGTFTNGAVTGKGVKEYSDGKRYEGDVVDGYREGQGKSTTSSGTYVGSFKGDTCHGHGKYVSNKETYEGAYENGKRHGQGELLFKWNYGYGIVESVFKGSFKDGEKWEGREHRNDRGGVDVYKEGKSVHWECECCADNCVIL